MASPSRIVGIDLGTTHTVVAWAEAGAQPSVFQLPQLLGRDEVGTAPLLPSFLYAPAEDEALLDPTGEPPWIVGQLARQRGQEVPGRVVASAKSWLCHPGVDREAPILPWASNATDAPRISPVDASTRLLGQVVRGFRTAFPEHPLEAQHVVLTVPASFDEVARELTVRAAHSAGLKVRLLEEPQAAFYDYLSRAGTAELESLLSAERSSALVLVCDVGGGTTDLTLIRVSRSSAGLALERTAVGRHLLLGGDNIDLALAHWCEARLVAAPERLDPLRFGQLVSACRSAKERLLGPDPPDEVPIRLLTRGASLVGATLGVSLPRAELERIVFDGFLPERELERSPRRAGLVGYGLPYETDPAITRHVFEFLGRHTRGDRVAAVLFNGGLFRAERAADRVLAALGHAQGEVPRRLADTDPDLAVARGAVAYGLALEGYGTRIAGGTAHGYYVGVEARGTARRALCVVPRGAAEGERHVALAEGLALRVGQPVRFELFASDTAGPHAPGELVEIDELVYSALPALVTELEHDVAGRSEIPVALTGELSPIGTVDLGCVELGGSAAERHFRLAFELRARAEARRSTQPPGRSVPPLGRSSPPGSTRAEAAIERVFGKGRSDVKGREVKDLLRELERLLGDRATWSGESCRQLFDCVAPKHAARRRSLDHERVFWMLVGYCLRPGFGHPQDRKRIALLAPLFGQGLSFQDEARGWQQFWIAWRRVAGGLPEDRQTELVSAVEPFLAPAELKLKKPKGFRPQAEDELIATASWLERLAPERRAQLGRWLVERTWTDRDPRLWTAIARIGARVPAYASVHHVVEPGSAERWLDHLLREKWEQVPTAAAAAVQLARVTGDRARDVSEKVRRDVARRLEQSGAGEAAVRAVSELVPIEDVDRANWFGEELPVGLRLITSDDAEPS